MYLAYLTDTFTETRHQTHNSQYCKLCNCQMPFRKKLATSVNGQKMKTGRTVSTKSIRTGI